MKRIFIFTTLFVFLSSATLFAQTTDSTDTKNKVHFDASLDLLSNYIWRGVTLDKGPCLQPSIFVDYKNLKLSLLGSYSFKYDFNNIILNLGYTFHTAAGDITPLVNDYYYPYDPVKFNHFKGSSNSFSHLIETGVQYNATKIPLRLYGSVNVHNDPRHSTYFEGGYKFTSNGVEVEPLVGGTATKSPDWLLAEKAGLTNIGFKATKKIKISDAYSLPLIGTVSYHTQQSILNVMVDISIF